MTPRPKWRAYLLLARVSNLPTVWSNTLAGAAAVAGGAAVGDRADTVAGVALAASLFYTGGMFLNDAFDADFDAAHRPERPIPAGDVSRSEAVVIGAGCLIAAEVLLARSGVGAATLGALLAAAIVFYDARHKGVSWAPVVMGVCRGLVYCIAAMAIVASLPASVAIGALLITAYVALLTVVARRAGARARWLVPTLIAGISIVDAVFIGVVAGAWPVAAVAAAGFPLTLFLQRFVPGD